MGKIKNVLIGAAALCCPFLAGTSTYAGTALRTAAYYSAGAFELPAEAPSPTESDTENSYSSTTNNTSARSPEITAPPVSTKTSIAENDPPESSSTDTPETEEPAAKLGRVITLNRTESADDADYS